jgi:dTMP kinase
MVSRGSAEDAAAHDIITEFPWHAGCSGRRQEATMATQDSSVRMNLKELFAMEADRRAEEAVAAERARAEAEARRERERLERERHIAEARAEERRAAEEEQRRRDAELEARLSTLRDQLAEVQAEREAMHRKVAELAQPASPAPRRGVWMASVMAAASMVAAVTATWVAWPRPEPVVAELAPTAVEAPAAPAPVAAEPAPPAAVEEAPGPVAAPSGETAAPVERPSRPPRRDRTPVVRAEREPADRLGSQLDALSGGDRRDVLSPELLP